MRIWYPIRITLAHGVRGGMERQADTLARGLVARGHTLTTVTTAHPDGRLHDEDGGVETLYVPRTTWRKYQPHWWQASYYLLAERHRAQPYDIILSQSAGGLGYLEPAKRQLGLPSVVVLHGSNRREFLTTWHGARNPRGIYRLLRLAWRIPPLWLRWLRVKSQVAHWIAISPTIAQNNQFELGIAPQNMTVVPNGVDLQHLRPDRLAPPRLRERLDLPEDALVLVMVTRLEMEKGVQVALSALARLRPTHPHLYLLIAGKGVYAATLQARAQSLGLGDHVRFLGYVDHSELAMLLSGSDVFIMASLGPEGLPVSVIEAQAAGLPVVVSDVSGASAALMPDQTGLLYPPGDGAALADRLQLLLDDPARRQAMGVAARSLAERRFSVAAMVGATETILAAHCATRSPKPDYAQ